MPAKSDGAHPRSDTLLMERDGAVAVLRLNRPRALNALSSQLRRALHRAVLELDADETVEAIVLTGAGDRAFTAGLDLKEAAANAGGYETPEDNPVAAIEQCRTPIIVAVNGLCITGGLEIMLACDVVYAASTATFADTHVRVGLLPGWGLSQRMARQIGLQRAKEISLSGNFVDAARAFEIGLVNRVFEPEDLLPAAVRLAHDIADADRRIVALYKQIIDEGVCMELPLALTMEHERAVAHFARLSRNEIEAGSSAAAQRNRSQDTR